MEDKQLNEKESLELIAQMIRNTQQRLEKVHAIPFLIFGYITVITSIVVWYLQKTTPNSLWNLLWLAIPIVGGITVFALFYNKRPRIRTFVDKAVDYVWWVCGGTVMAGTFIPNLWKFVPVLFTVSLLISLGTTLTGLITKVRILVISGIIGIAAALAIPFVKGLDSILFFAAIFIVMMVIPGHILYWKGRK